MTSVQGIGEKLRQIPLVVLLVIGSLVAVLPVVWVFATSFKPALEIFQVPSRLFPSEPTVSNYAGALAGSDLGAYLLNSLVTAGGATGIALVLAIPAAFGFAQFRFRLGGFLFAAAVATRMFPTIALGIPYFLQLRSLNLLDTKLGLIICYVPLVLPLLIWMLEGFFRQFEREIIEAARVDGLGVLSTIFRIVVPLSTPAIGVAALFGFLTAWNEFVIALTVTRTTEAATMPIGIASYITAFQSFWGQMAAASALYLVPVLVITMVAQRGIVQGLTAGSTKG
jgi:multiple sugar transport system permease protein